MHVRQARWLLTACLSTFAVGGFALLAPAGALASSNAQFRVTFALNCDHASCAPMFGYGGEWGSVALTPDGNGQAQVTDCGHTVGGGGPGLAGAFHQALDVTWQEFSSPVAPTPITPTDPNGNYLSFSGGPPGPNQFALVVPATYGHYSLTLDGAKAEITIAP